MTSPLTPPPVEPPWIALVDDVASSVLGPDDRSGRALAAQVATLSRVYTGREGDLSDAVDARAARLRFWLLRDLPKIEGPLAELDPLPPGPTWRLLDLGAGYGTTTLGVARLAHRAGIERLEVTAVEQDGNALDAFRALARQAPERDLTCPITLDVERADVTSLDPARLGRFDLITLGLSLGEVFGTDEGSEVEAEAWLRRLADQLSPNGALVVLEPALKTHARALQRLRDRFVADTDGPRVHGPCFTDAPCPLLRRERDWCHSQLPLPLPEALAPIAEAAGLRRTRLTYAYLTLRAEEPRADRWRIVGGPVKTKGKTEWDVCGPAGLVRLRRLKRDVKAESSPLDELERGAVLRIDAPLEDGGSLRVRGEVDCPS